MKKTLTMVLALALVFALGVGTTLAWLTAETTEVKNTFSTSTIGVELEESKNLDLQMVPGHTITKDPKAWVTEGSEAAWLFVEVTESANFDTYMTYAIAEGWTVLQAETEQADGTKVTVLCKEVETPGTEYGIIEGNTVTVKPDVTKDMMETAETAQPTLTFKAYVHQLYQSNGVKFDAATAWDNLK